MLSDFFFKGSAMLFTPYTGREKQFGWVITHVRTSAKKMTLEDRSWPLLVSAVAMAYVDHALTIEIAEDTDAGFAILHLARLVREGREIAQHLEGRNTKTVAMKPLIGKYKANSDELCELFTEIHVPHCFPENVLGARWPVPDMARAIIRSGECEAVIEVPLEHVHGWPRNYPNAYYEDLRDHKKRSEAARYELSNILSKHM